MQVVFSPLTACKSLGTHQMGAYRLFVLAKTLAGARDSVGVSQVENLTREFISRRQFQRDKSAALRLGLFKTLERRNGDKVYLLASHEKAALLLGATKSSASTRCVISLEDLFGGRWQALAFTAWQKGSTRNGLLLVSQKKQEERTGIVPQMQRKYNRLCGVTSRRNYAVSNISASQLNGVREFGVRAAPFAFKDHGTGRSYIAWHLPSSRVVCADSSAVNTSNIDGSLISTNQNTSRKSGKLFLYNDISLTRVLRSCAPEQRDLYVFSHTSSSGAGIFTHFAI